MVNLIWLPSWTNLSHGEGSLKIKWKTDLKNNLKESSLMALSQQMSETSWTNSWIKASFWSWASRQKINWMMKLLLKFYRRVPLTEENGQKKRKIFIIWIKAKVSVSEWNTNQKKILVKMLKKRVVVLIFLSKWIKVINTAVLKNIHI